MARQQLPRNPNPRIGAAFARHFGDAVPSNDPPARVHDRLIEAWDKAGPKQRHDFVLVRKVEIMRTQQRSGNTLMSTTTASTSPTISGACRRKRSCHERHIRFQHHDDGHHRDGRRRRHRARAANSRPSDLFDIRNRSSASRGQPAALLPMRARSASGRAWPSPPPASLRCASVNAAGSQTTCRNSFVT
jgi:hypothetical protein